MLYRIFNVVFAALLFGVLILAVFINRNTHFEFRWYLLLAAAACGIVASFGLSLLFQLMAKPSKLVEIIVVALVLALYFALQMVVGWQVRTLPGQSWDYGVVYSFAQDFVVNGRLPDLYFAYFPNNAGLYTFLCGLFGLLSLFGVGDFFIATMVVNALAIDLSLLLLYFCGRRLFGTLYALLLLFGSLCMLPFLLYTPILYTDTLSLPFPIAAVLLWLTARSRWREGSFKGAMGRFCALSALCAVGAQFKVTVLIVWIAAAIDLLLLVTGRGRWKVLLAGLGVAAVLYGGLYVGLRHSPLLPRYDYDRDGIPFTQWIMMGLGGEGGYQNSDYVMVLEQEGKDARGDLIAGEIGRRLSDYGVLGTVKHLLVKLSYTFGDGTYDAAGRLDLNAMQAGPLHEWFVFSGRYFAFTAYIAFALEAALLFWAAVGSLKAVIRENNALTFVRVAVFGLVLFLLLWETISRYLIHFLPLFLLCSLEALPRPSARVERAFEREQPGEAPEPEPASEPKPGPEPPVSADEAQEAEEMRLAVQSAIEQKKAAGPQSEGERALWDML